MPERDYRKITDKQLSEMSLEELNELAADLLEDAPRGTWRRLQRERTRRFRLDELSRTQLAKQAAGASDEEWDALRQTAIAQTIAADTAAHASDVATSS